MMLSDILARADGIRPNTIPAEVKAAWVYELEAEFAESMGLEIPESPFPDNGELLMPDAYSSSYVWHVCKNISAANKDTEVYALDSQVASQEKGRALAWYRRGHESKRRVWKV